MNSPKSEDSKYRPNGYFVLQVPVADSWFLEVYPTFETPKNVLFP